jgi:hypothetical protein
MEQDVPIPGMMWPPLRICTPEMRRINLMRTFSAYAGEVDPAGLPFLTRRRSKLFFALSSTLTVANKPRKLSFRTLTLFSRNTVPVSGPSNGQKLT